MKTTSTTIQGTQGEKVTHVFVPMRRHRSLRSSGLFSYGRLMNAAMPHRFAFAALRALRSVMMD